MINYFIIVLRKKLLQTAMITFPISADRFTNVKPVGAKSDELQKQNKIREREVVDISISDLINSSIFY